MIRSTALLVSILTASTALGSVDSRLRDLGLRGDTLRSSIDSLSPEEQSAALFLLEHMPYSDLVRIQPQVLIEHVRLACEARRSFPWGDDYPDDVFRSYVLPYRSSQEPIERWRAMFLDLLRPRLAGVEDISAAAVIVNRVAGELITFKPTQRRDQGPLETLSSGFGRCEEMVIFFDAMLRSVAIPARKVWTPWWQHMDNNHAWTEVWTPNGWRYTGAAEPRDSLGSAWFDDAAKRAALVLSQTFGPPAASDECVRDGGEVLVNCTRAYVETGTLSVAAVQSGGPVPQATASVSVFNFGAIRSAVGVECDSNGVATISIGPGRYVVSAGRGDAFGWSIVDVRARDTTRAVIDLDAVRAPTSFRVGAP